MREDLGKQARQALYLSRSMEFGVDSQSFARYMLLYQSALKLIYSRLDILNDEFQLIHRRNPIAHITSRIKQPEKIMEKLDRKGFEVSCDSMWNNLYDIAGVRIICSFLEDIYRIVDLLKQQEDLGFIKEIDYIRYPKENGYRSYHMIVAVPVYLSGELIPVNVEIQIRTIAMDFWATLEHDLYYKKGKSAPLAMIEALTECAEDIANIDSRMQFIKNQVDDLDANGN